MYFSHRHYSDDHSWFYKIFSKIILTLKIKFNNELKLINS